MNQAHEAELQAARVAVRDRLRVAACVEFGPRYLHSTRQAYKGGPNSGVFVHISCDDAEDLPVPGKAYTFGELQAAQAAGDRQALAGRERPVVRLHLTDRSAGVAQLLDAVGALRA